MSLPWNIPLECAPEFKKKPAPPEPSLLKHFCNLDLNGEPCEEVYTGLMCDIGVENKEPQTIQRLIAAGVTIARIKPQGLDEDLTNQIIQSIRQAVYAYSAEMRYVYPVAVAMDIKGPDLTTGNLKGGLKATADIVESTIVRLTKDSSWQNSGTADCLYVNFETLIELHPEDVIWIDSLTSDKIKLVVTDVGDDSVDCVCVIGGKIGPKMAVRVGKIPQEKDSVESLSFSTSEVVTFDRMQMRVARAVALDVDALLIPKVQFKDDVMFIKQFLVDKGKHVLLIACLETELSFENFDEILSVSDGIFIDRNSLCLDLPVEKIFIAVKIMIAKCNLAGKHAIVKSVINEQIPILCVTDTANLVLDGVDVISLEMYYDSPLKKLSVDSVHMAEVCVSAASVICKQAERIIWKPQIYGNIELMQRPVQEPTESICISAVELSMRSNAVVIIVLSNSGRTAKVVSQVRPSCPVITVTRTCRAARQLRFWRGIRSVHYSELPKPTWRAEVEARVQAALDYCKLKHIIRAGDPFVTLTSTRRGSGYCDALRLLYCSSADTVYIDIEPDRMGPN